MPFPWSEQYNAIEIIKIHWKEIGNGRNGLNLHIWKTGSGKKSKKILLYTINSVLLKFPEVQQ